MISNPIAYQNTFNLTLKIKGYFDSKRTKDIKVEFRVMASTLSIEMGMMDAQLKR